MQQAVHQWLSRLLAETTSPDEAARLADALTPLVEEALKASALDMFRQCSVAQLGESEDLDAVKDWTVSVNEAVAAAIRKLEHQRT
jgi:hypothetical protein